MLKDIVTHKNMLRWIAYIMVGWDNDDTEGYHDAVSYSGMRYEDFAQTLAWLTIDVVPTNYEDNSYNTDPEHFMNKCIDFCIHDVVENYEFDEDTVEDKEWWMKAESVWRSYF